MQWALVGGFGEAGAAAFCALLLTGAIYLIRAIAAALPKINLGFFTIDLPRYFNAVAQPIESWLVGATNELWADAEWWMRGIGWTLTQMFDGMRDLFEHQAGFIDHIHNAVIPQAGAHALSAAATYANEQSATLRRDISAARADFAKLAQADSDAEYAKAERALATVHHELVAISATGVRTAEKYADREVAKLRDYVNSLPHVTGATGAAGAAGTAGVSGGAVALPDVPAILGISDIPLSLVGAVTAVGTAVVALAKEFDTCAVRSCAGPNNLQNLLNDILGLGELAAFASFLDDAINHPGQVEKEYADKFRSIYETVTGAGGGVVSELEAVLSL